MTRYYVLEPAGQYLWRTREEAEGYCEGYLCQFHRSDAAAWTSRNWA
jgi:hypothetical protein